MKFALTSALVGAAFAMSAGAVSAQDWSGPYVGVAAGVTANNNADDEVLRFDTNLDGNFNDTVRTTTNADAFASSPTVPAGFCGGEAIGNNFAAGCRDDDKVKGEFGIRAGMDWQSGNFVYGGLVEATTSQVTDYVTGFSTTPAAYQFNRSVDDVMVAARARVGYSMGNMLPYVTGGVAMRTWSRASPPPIRPICSTPKGGRTPSSAGKPAVVWNTR